MLEVSIGNTRVSDMHKDILGKDEANEIRRSKVLEPRRRYDIKGLHHSWPQSEAQNCVTPEPEVVSQNGGSCKARVPRSFREQMKWHLSMIQFFLVSYHVA